MVTTITAIGVSAVGIVADVPPNTTGLPGISTLSNMVGALLTVGLIACVAGLVLAAIVWAIGSHSSNPHLAGRGKSGVLVAFVAAVLDRWGQRPGRLLRHHRQGNLGAVSRRADLMRTALDVPSPPLRGRHRRGGSRHLECGGVGRESPGGPHAGAPISHRRPATAPATTTRTPMSPATDNGAAVDPLRCLKPRTTQDRCRAGAGRDPGGDRSRASGSPCRRPAVSTAYPVGSDGGPGRSGHLCHCLHH